MRRALKRKNRLIGFKRKKDKSFWGAGGRASCRVWAEPTKEVRSDAPRKPCRKTLNASRRVYAASIEKENRLIGFKRKKDKSFWGAGGFFQKSP